MAGLGGSDSDMLMALMRDDNERPALPAQNKYDLRERITHT